jgi:CheY-specific phosphatase CheX
MNIDLQAGEVLKSITAADADISGIIGIGGDRVGYIIIAANRGTARLVAQQMLMVDEPDDTDITDAIGELANNIAGAVKTNHSACGNVALGLPLIVSGQLRAVTEPPNDDPSISVQCKGVTIPFQTSDGTVTLKVMVYM